MPRAMDSDGVIRSVHVLTCCLCQQVLRLRQHPSKTRARAEAQRRGWASTAMDHPVAKDVCPSCLEKWIVSHDGNSTPFMRLVSEAEAGA